MRNPRDFSPDDAHMCLLMLSIDVDDDFMSDHFDEDIWDNYATKILDALYEDMTIEEVVKLNDHLTKEQQSDLVKVLEKYPNVFSTELGLYPHRKFHIELEENGRPVHGRPYPVPRAHEEVFKKELAHLVKIGVLSPQGSSDWGLPHLYHSQKGWSSQVGQ